jgi:Short C-terminal domain
LLADVEYDPSIFFWIFILIGIFTTVGWLIPIAFFLIQKNSVKQSVESTFSRIRNEFSDSISPKPSNGSISDLESLANLKSKGVITEEEFAAKKAQILGL